MLARVGTGASRWHSVQCPRLSHRTGARASKSGSGHASIDVRSGARTCACTRARTCHRAGILRAFAASAWTAWGAVAADEKH